MTVVRVGQKGELERMAPLEQEEIKENPEISDLRDPWDYKVLLVQLVPQVHQVHRALEEQEDCQVPLVSPVFLVSLENPETQVPRENLEPLDDGGRGDKLEIEERLELMDWTVLLVQPGLPEEAEIPEQRESVVIKEDPVQLVHPARGDLLDKPVPTVWPVQLENVERLVTMV